MTTNTPRTLPFSPVVRVHSLDIAAPTPASSVPWKTWLAVVAVWVCVGLGIGLRVHGYARNPSLWIDEAMLALNVVHRSPAQLLEPLDLNQGAPLGFLMLSRASVSAFGPSEYALRLVPFLAGLAGLAMFVPLAYRALPLSSARLAVMLFALSPYLAGYAAEFKQYESDAAIVVGLLWLGVGATNPRRLFALAVAGVLAVWCSHPAAFVLGGIGLALVAEAGWRHDHRAILRIVAVIGTWLLSFSVCFLVFTRKLGMNDYLREYWAGTFAPLPPTSPGDLAWFVDHFFAFFDNPGGFHTAAAGMAGFAGVLYLVGCRALARENRTLMAMLVLPLLLALFASGLQKYPFAGRLMLFAVPPALLLVAHGAIVTATLLGNALPGTGAVLLVALFAAPVSSSVNLVREPLHAEDTRELVAHVHAGWQPGDRLYVFHGAAPAFAYYLARFPIPLESVQLGRDIRGANLPQFQGELAVLRGSPQVWVLLAHRNPAEEATIRAYLDGMGTRLETRHGADAVAFRYDLRATNTR